MRDIWFIFDDKGDFLFKTTDENRISSIPDEFAATYIVKNPEGYDSTEEQKICYDIVGNTIVFSKTLTHDSVNSSTNDTEKEILDYKQLVTDLEKAQQDIIQLNQLVAILSNKLDNTSGTINNIFSNIE